MALAPGHPWPSLSSPPSPILPVTRRLPTRTHLASSRSRAEAQHVYAGGGPRHLPVSPSARLSVPKGLPTSSLLFPNFSSYPSPRSSCCCLHLTQSAVRFRALPRDISQFCSESVSFLSLCVCTRACTAHPLSSTSFSQACKAFCFLHALPCAPAHPWVPQVWVMLLSLRRGCHWFPPSLSFSVNFHPSACPFI